MKRYSHCLLIGVLATAGSAVAASAGWKDDVWTEINRTSPLRPTAGLELGRLIADLKEDVFTDIDRKAPLRPDDGVLVRQRTATIGDNRVQIDRSAPLQLDAPGESDVLLVQDGRSGELLAGE